MTESRTSTSTQNQSAEDSLFEAIQVLIYPLGYELVHLEVLNGRQKLLRVFIDHANDPTQSIGVEDCVRVSRTLDEPLDQMPQMDQLFSGPYELEVSSPGVDRPLRRTKDYERFTGREARIHLYRPLTLDEIDNEDYQKKNPKQKNFLGIIKGVVLQGDQSKIVLDIPASKGSKAVKKGFGKKGKAVRSNRAASAAQGLKDSANRSKISPTTNSEEERHDRVMIPLPLISKANLEPDFEILESRADTESANGLVVSLNPEDAQTKEST